MTHRDNVLRAALFGHPDSIPVHFGFDGQCWRHYDQSALKDMMAAHPRLFPGGPPKESPVVPRYLPWRRAGVRFEDSWGCIWVTAEDGVTGAVVEHPLADLDRLPSFKPPDPERHSGWVSIDWAATRQRLADARARGDLAADSLRHGHTFLTLTYLRGYEEFVMDMADQRPEVDQLLAMVEQFNSALVEKFLSAGVEWLGYPEDLGMQVGPMLSVEQFRRYILPTYRRLMAPARQAGVVIHMHSDGDVRLLAGDLLSAGVQVLNIQDRVNGLDWMAANLKGRVAIDLDIDRQFLLQSNDPRQVRRHVDRIMDLLYDPAGGLMLNYSLLPGPSLQQIGVLMDALEEVAGR